MPTRDTAPDRRSPSGIVALTTDFGVQDWFVGVMKGVMLEVEPTLRFLDITHAIPPGDIRAGAFCLMNAWNFCPPGTVHLAVVDPGVGGTRRAMALEAGGRLYVGPDNGLASWAIRKYASARMHLITNASLCRHPPSTTFHGRDVFAPVAAFLARGGPLESVGPRGKTWARLPWPTIRSVAGGFRGEVLYLDRFGNAITNLPSTPEDAGRLRLLVEGRTGPMPVVRCYAEILTHHPAAVAASTGFLEIALNQASAAVKLGIQPGDRVRLWTE